MCGCDLKVTSPEPKPAIQSDRLSAGTTEISTSPIGRPWRDLYKEAVFENDREKLTARIDDAETSLLARARELFHAGSKDIRERQELDAALYALYAVKSAAISAKAKKQMKICSDDQIQAA
jgi:hypothetical protein